MSYPPCDNTRMLEVQGGHRNEATRRAQLAWTSIYIGSADAGRYGFTDQHHLPDVQSMRILFCPARLAEDQTYWGGRAPGAPNTAPATAGKMHLFHSALGLCSCFYS